MTMDKNNDNIVWTQKIKNNDNRHSSKDKQKGVAFHVKSVIFQIDSIAICVGLRNAVMRTSLFHN